MAITQTQTLSTRISTTTRFVEWNERPDLAIYQPDMVAQGRPMGPDTPTLRL